MKSNKHFWRNALLAITLSIVSTLPTNAKEADKYEGNYNSEHQDQVKSELVAENTHGQSHEKANAQGGFISKQTSEIEFTFAVLFIVLGAVISDKFYLSRGQISTSSER